MPIVAQSFDLGKFGEKVEKIGKIPLDCSKPLRQVGLLIQRRTDERFIHQKDPWGIPWVQLLDETLIRRRKKGKDGKILMDSGMLRNSVSGETDPNGIFRLTKVTMEVGTNLIYGATHQFGRGKIPQREFLGINKYDEKETLKTFDEWYKERLREEFVDKSP